MSFFLSYVVEVSCISLLHPQICRECKCSAQPQGLYAETLSASAVKKKKKKKGFSRMYSKVP